jgi:hypothetical protein
MGPSSQSSRHPLGCLPLTLFKQLVVPALRQPWLCFVAEALRPGEGETVYSSVWQCWMQCLHVCHAELLPADMVLLSCCSHSAATCQHDNICTPCTMMLHVSVDLTVAVADTVALPEQLQRCGPTCSFTYTMQTQQQQQRWSVKGGLVSSADHPTCNMPWGRGPAVPAQAPAQPPVTAFPQAPATLRHAYKQKHRDRYRCIFQQAKLHSTNLGINTIAPACLPACSPQKQRSPQRWC